jgi:hypothetical protein
MEWPPATGTPAAAQTEAPPARIRPMVSTGSLPTGMPTMASAKIGLAPMA